MIRSLLMFLALFLQLNSFAQSVIAGTVSVNDNFTHLPTDFTVRSTYSSSSSNIPGTTYSVDINYDGELDFAIQGYDSQIGMGGYFSDLRITPLTGTMTSKYVAASINSCTLMNGPNVQTVTANMATAFNASDIIDNTTLWDMSTAYLYKSETYGAITPGSCSMQNFYTSPAYIGIKLVCGSTAIFGWIKVKNYTNSPPQHEILVESYAINKSNCGVGIHERNLSETILLFPNPSQNSFTIKLPENFSEALISVTDLAGKTIISNKTINNNESITNSQLPTGVYIVKIQTKDFTIHKRLIKE